MERAPAERFPPQIKYLAWNEAAERFSYYGMTSILTLYLVEHLGMARHLAISWYSAFTAAVYLMPIVGGVVADRFFGRYRTILWLSLGYVAGHLTIAAWESAAGLLAGCALIALGSGGIKPNASAFAGDQIPPGRSGLLQRLYDLWYWMINLGSLASQLAVPWLYDRYGPRIGFGTPALAMALALTVFWMGRRRYTSPPPAGPSPHGFLRVLASALRHRRRAGRQGGWLGGARLDHPAWAVEGARAVFRISAVFAAVSAFWALFFQYGSSWTLQANDMERRVTLLGRDYLVPPGQMQTLDALFVLALIPLFGFAVYPGLERLGWRMTPLRKMTVGMFVMPLSFVAAAGVEAMLRAGLHPHVAWQVPQYFFLATAEVMVSVTALEFAYTQAPAQMKSAIMGLWFLTFSAGSLLTSAVSALNRFEGVAYFAFFAVLQLGAAAVFALVAWWYPVAPPARDAAEPA
jgi:POT family proton-dependent oligopeptide transporter